MVLGGSPPEGKSDGCLVHSCLVPSTDVPQEGVGGGSCMWGENPQWNQGEDQAKPRQA